MITINTITNPEDIKEPNVKYYLCNEHGNPTDKWIDIQRRNYGIHDEYSLNYKFHNHQMFNFVTTGDYVKTWKTFNGAKRYALKNLLNLS